MKELNLQELTLNEMQEINGGWDWDMAIGCAAAVSCLGPKAAVIGFIVGGLIGK